MVTGPTHGGLGLRSLSSHAAAAYIASLCSSGFRSLSVLHPTSAVVKFNSSVSPSDVVSVESLAQKPTLQKTLSAKIDDFQFNLLFTVLGRQGLSFVYFSTPCIIMAVCCPIRRSRPSFKS